MRSRCSPGRLGFFLLVAVPLLTMSTERCGWLRADETAAEEDRERPLMERFLALLERSPRRGTALDRVYAYHADRGTLDTLIGRFRDRTGKDENDGAAWMILGLLEAKRGRDTAAVAALRQAETHRAGDPLAPYYLGQSLILSGQPEVAVDAFERALKREPTRADLLEIAQTLGRLHQRAHRFDRAMAVWTRLERLFPDDLRVQEQIASAMAEDAQLEPALERYETLAKKTRDSYKGVQFRIEAAGIEAKLGRHKVALAHFEAILGSLNPESWLYRDVRRRIEEVFLGGDDPAGLALYYERWIEKTPDDFEAMARLGATLSAQGRQAEASAWFAKAVKLAPSRKEIRLALIDQLARDEKIAEAATHYEAMCQADPGNPDLIRDWGRLLLKDGDRPPAERKARAAAVWRRLIDGKPDDPVAAARLAELLRQAEMTEEAIAMYQKAIALAPDAPQYREYLGEYYYSLKRTGEALSTWRRIAAGPARDAKNLARLAEVVAGFGYRDEAIQAISDACKLDPETFDLRLRRADLLHEARRFDDAGVELEAAATLAGDAEQRESTLDRQIKNSQSAGTLAARTMSLRDQLGGDGGRDAESWRRLARYLEADQTWDEAISAIRRALALDERSVASWSVAARLFETTKAWREAADAYRKLATIDRQGRGNYLASVARIEARLGRRVESLAAGRELLAAASSNVDHYQTYADLCFQLGEDEEGLETLRKATRANAGDPKPWLSLAGALARAFRTDEAIEHYWRAFEKTSTLDGKLDIVSRLAELSLQADRFQRLVARFDRLKGQERSRREAIFCLAQAYKASGDQGAARRELESLLAANPRDLPLLAQLSALAETEGDLDDAIAYQKRLDEINPNGEAAARLAHLYAQAGQEWEADAIWERLASETQNTEQALRTADSLRASAKYESALKITNRLLRQAPEDWEVLYREARILEALNRPKEAADRFAAILKIRRGDDDDATTKVMRRPSRPATAAVPTARTPSGATVMTGAIGQAIPVPYSFPAGKRLTARQEIRAEFGLQPATVVGKSQGWVPQDFGQARMAALAGLSARSGRDGTREEWLKQQHASLDRTPHDPRPYRDWFYLQLILGSPAATYEAALALARVDATDPAAQWWLLVSLPSRARPFDLATDNRPPMADDEANVLAAAELDQVLASHSLVRRVKPEWLWRSGAPSLTTLVIDELQRAGRAKEIDDLYRESVASATDLGTIAIAADLAAERGDVDALLNLFEAFERVPGKHAGPAWFLSTPSGNVPSPVASMAKVMHRGGDTAAHVDIIKLIDRYMSFLQGPEQVADRARSAHPSSTSRQRVAVPVWLNNVPRTLSIDYPLPGRTLDFAAILLLRNAFEVDLRDGLLEVLIAHVRRPIDAGESEAKRLYAHLALSALLWWSDKKDESLGELERASTLAAADPELRLTLAELRATRQQWDQALALVESIETSDQGLRQRRELLAFRIAAQAGDRDRARKAAETLLALNLPQNDRMQLVVQLQRLGLGEIATAMSPRPRQNPRDRSSTRLALLRSYKASGRTEAAVQVAAQILRRAATGTPNPRVPRSDPALIEAIGVLESSGKLAEFIEQTESRIKREPQSLALYQALAAYYHAAGQPSKIPALFEKAAQARPDDARFRLHIAMSLAQSGETTAAMAHYRAAINRDPSLLGDRFAEIFLVFAQARKFDELVVLLRDVDLTRLGSTPNAASIVSLIMKIPPQYDNSQRLYRKVWEAFPDQRSLLMLSDSSQLKNSPEVYRLSREQVLPGPDLAPVDPWHGLDQVLTRSNDGTTTTTATRLLDLATRQQRLDELAHDIERALRRSSTWSGGKALLALIRLREGRTNDARLILEGLLTDRRTAIPTDTRISLAQELQVSSPVRPIAISLYEGAIHKNPGALRNGAEFRASPIPRLVDLYLLSDQPAKARDLMLAVVRECREFNSSLDSPPGLLQQMSALDSAAEPFLKRGFLLDSLRVSRAIRSLTQGLSEDQLLIFQDNRLIDQARLSGEAAFRRLDSTTLAPTLQALLKPEPERWGEALDLILMVRPPELEKAVVVSLPAIALRQAAREPKLWAEVKTSLDALVARYPEDFSVMTVAALATFAESDRGAMLKAVDRLERLVAARPLDRLPDASQGNASQQAEAAKRLALWLVSRECRQFEETGELGRSLAKEAMEAARRQPDNRWLSTMLRISGDDALRRGNRDEAEADWARMLDIALADPAPRKDRRPAPSPSSPPAGTGPGNPTTVPAPAVSRRPRALPIDRFEQAMKIARLAAENDLHTLSVRAVLESLKGGPPFTPVGPESFERTMGARPGVILPSPYATSPSSVSPWAKVGTSLEELDASWRTRNAPAEAVYRALCEIVMPSSRPDKILLYEPGFPVTAIAIGARRPPSEVRVKRVASILAEWAVRAGKADDLRHRIEQRQVGPTDLDSARSILSSLATAELRASLR